MKKSYSIKDLFIIILSRLPYIVISAVVCAVAMFGVSKFMIDPKYQSNISLYVKNSNKAPDSNQSVNVNDLNVSKSLVSTYIVILNNDIVMDEISDILLSRHSEAELANDFKIVDGRITNRSLKACYNMVAANQTEVLKITATTKRAELSQELCNVMAEVAPEFLIRVVGAGSVEKIGDAKLYPNKVSPDVTKNTILGGIAGFILSILLVFMIDFFDNTVKSTEEIQDRFNKPILGEIPHIGGKTKKKEIGKSSDRKKKLLFNDKNNEIPFSVVENYKSIRTNVTFSLSTAENKIFAVTSSLPSEGKSVTIANLAVTMAEADKKVLLIDADMRKPVQHKNFSLKNKKGLSTVLSREAVFDDCVNRGVKKNLDVLTAGVIPPNPSELLASKKMREMIDGIKEMYDYILIDTPPILQMTDVIGLADIIAGVTVVLSYGNTTYQEVQEVQKKLELGNCNLMGFILNNITRGAGNSYSYSKYGRYKYGYKYKQYDMNYRTEQSEEKEEEKKESDSSSKKEKESESKKKK